MKRRRLWAGLALFAALLALDLFRAPDQQVSAAILLAAIDGYQATGSRLFRRLGVRCRFEPSCSRYAEAAIRRDGALVGSFRTGWRILRCGPWTAPGTHDPPG